MWLGCGRCKFCPISQLGCRLGSSGGESTVLNYLAASTLEPMVDVFVEVVWR